ncbi:MAG: NAD(P)H-binding protein [Rhodobacteraceae bacterium]|nr:NAD(P)H-binding protein [Paracoccaceae bacterium]
MTQAVPKTAGRVMLLGATGSIGRAVLAELVRTGHDVIAPIRAGSKAAGIPCDFTSDALSSLLSEYPCDAVISCLASRSGAPEDAWAVDHALNSRVLTAALQAGVPRFVLLSAICVQKPKLAFQQAKLAFEAELQAAPLDWTIVRPTAFFKSLSGQVARLKAGKPFLVFGDGALTACKPISDADLARFMVGCLTRPETTGQILPIGGPGPALTPLEQGQLLFKALGLPPKFRHVPPAILSFIIALISGLGLISRSARAKAELAKIGRYYATESMLVWDHHTQSYDAQATPEFGSDTLADHYRDLVQNDRPDDRGAHAVF